MASKHCTNEFALAIVRDAAEIAVRHKSDGVDCEDEGDGVGYINHINSFDVAFLW